MMRKDISRQIEVAAGRNIKELEYWTHKLAGEPAKSSFPHDYKKTTIEKEAVKRDRGCMSFRLAGESYKNLVKLSKGAVHTQHIVLLAALTGLLSRYTGSDDISIGTPIYRQNTEAELINTMLVVRNQVYAGMAFKELLMAMKQTVLEAVANQAYPAALLPARLGIPLPDAGFAEDFPLFDVVLLVEEIHDRAYIGSFKPGMVFVFNMAGTDAAGEVEYDASKYSETGVGQVVRHFVRFLENALQSPGSAVGAVEILSSEEKHEILYRFNDTAVDFPEDRTIHGLFQEQAVKTPGKIAIVGLNSGDSAAGNHRYLSLTYRELAFQADRLGCILVQKGVGPDMIVGLSIERSLQMIIGVFGILKTGAAYLPIEPQSLEARKEYLLKDSNAKLMLTADVLDEKNETLSIGGHDPDPGIRLSSGLAYIIYTSGSTGKPKGVMIEHRSVVNRLHWMQRAYPLNEQDIILQKTTFVFDVSVWELFWWSFYGASLFLLEAGGEKNPAAIAAAVEKRAVTTMHFVPSMLHVFLEYLKDFQGLSRLRSLKRVFSSGEALAVAQVERFNMLLYKTGGAVLINLYGPTEATVDVSYYNCPTGENFIGISVPIGKPIDNIKLYIVNKELHLQPVGAPGELIIAGVGLARGYINNPGLTAEKFVSGWQGGTRRVHPQNPRLMTRETLKNSLNESSTLNAPPPPRSGVFEKTAPLTPAKALIKSFLGVQGAIFQKSPLEQKLYKTGDLARWQPDGNIEFLGRIDHQVKIRGFRIELGEIENRLLNHEKIKEAVVLAREDAGGEKYLSAYIVLDTSLMPGAVAAPGALDASQLRNYLLQELPDYMIPSRFIPVESIPLTTNGKVDKRALDAVFVQLGTGKEYAPPENEEEEKIAGVWREVLQLGKVSVHDNFFEIGGDSLKIILVNTRLNEIFAKDIPATDMFKYPTIRALSRYIAGGTNPAAVSVGDREEELNKGKEKLQAFKKKMRRQ